MDAAADLRQAHRTSAVLAGSFIMSLVMYGVVANIFRLTQPTFEGFVRLPDPAPVRYALWSAALAVTAAVPVLRRRLLTKSMSDNRGALIRKLQTSTVVTGGIAEVPALLGFILVALNGLYVDFYLLAALSLVLMLAFPRYQAWEDWIREPPPRP
ncbi:MAG TPA: hypothetical protein VFN71_08590 [Methylomirabilota bacterium]|nr:hypothetical protein [Methylomirabilota bacterium]